MPEKFVDPEESTCGTHMAAEVLLGSSAMGGKHTIVKVMGDKGHPIELSDINLV